jgi:hypothetical protein
VSVDQGAIRGSRRSNPATYSGLLDPIRKAFAKANGVIYTDLAMMAGDATTCEDCGGEAVRGIGAGIPPRRPRHQRGASEASGRVRGRVHATSWTTTSCSPAAGVSASSRWILLRAQLDAVGGGVLLDAGDAL